MVGRAVGRPGRRAELAHHQPPAGAGHAGQLGQRGVRVRDVAQAERDRHRVERGVGEGQREGVGGDLRDGAVGAGAQHAQREVGGHAPGTRPRQRDRRHRRPRREVEHPLAGPQVERRAGQRAPAPVLAGGEHGVGEVVAAARPRRTSRRRRAGPCRGRPGSRCRPRLSSLACPAAAQPHAPAGPAPPRPLPRPAPPARSRRPRCGRRRGPARGRTGRTRPRPSRRWSARAGTARRAPAPPPARWRREPDQRAGERGACRGPRRWRPPARRRSPRRRRPHRQRQRRQGGDDHRDAHHDLGTRAGAPPAARARPSPPAR